MFRNERRMLAWVAMLLCLSGASGIAAAQVVDVAIGEHEITDGESLTIPIEVSDLTELFVLSSRLELIYCSDVIICSGEPTLGSVWPPEALLTWTDEDAGGGLRRLTILIISPGEASGEGSLASVSFLAVGPPGSESVIELAATLNEGSPETETHDGRVTIVHGPQAIDEESAERPSKRLIDHVPSVVRGASSIRLCPQGVKPISLALYGPDGRRVWQGTRSPGSEGEVFADPLHAPAGLYFWMVRQGARWDCARVLILH
ncbi:MAG: hypothetical protein GF330_12790 [Candidatus Eisenbacteria bacterium]|nr:hypothetical protein [Candidatus Eisenbacteria bacterium]